MVALLTREGDADWAESAMTLIDSWAARGDGAAVYENADLGSAGMGEIKVVSFGSPVAQLEGAEAPERLPDIGGDINWRYVLKGTYRPEGKGK
jgi:hypothetical protein